MEEINDAGGVNGRKIELIVRDTQSDPTKAVNAVAELTQRQKVSVIWGPVNSGEALAATPLIARDKVPMLHPCWVDELIDVKKYPMAFRIAPTNTADRRRRQPLRGRRAEAEEGRGHRRHHRLRHRLGERLRADAQGQGRRRSSITAMSTPRTRTSSPSCCACRDAGAQVIMPWSVNAGFLSRIINTRGAMGWDVPIVGQTTLGSGQTKALLEKPEYWNKVYSNNFRNC